MPKPRDYTGQVFYRLTAISYTGKYYYYGKHAKRIWLFQCDCGNQKEIIAEKVAKGETKSCGCRKGLYTDVAALQYSVYRESHYDDGDITLQQFIALSQQPCYYCNKWKPNKRTTRNSKRLVWEYHGLDRIDNSLPHILSNVVTCCWFHNSKKKSESKQHFIDDAWQIVFVDLYREIEEKFHV